MDVISNDRAEPNGAVIAVSVVFRMQHCGRRVPIALCDGIAHNTTVAARPSVVLDTNVLEAAFRSRRGASFALLSMVGAGHFDVVVSVALILEYEDVLLRSAGRPASSVADVLDYLCSVGRHQAIFYLWRPCLVDPADDMVLELAVAAGCDAIVTHNISDFSATRSFGIPAVRPADFLHEVRGFS